ncbi:MAG: MFS transporter [Promethearchaeota archaeon]|nr:MAG: MFS transporter [Candidatus Lokiarchaeota archaeon]
MMQDNESEFKKKYVYIFCFFYTVQGLYNGIQWIILPIYLITVVENIDFATILQIFSIAILPWSLKFLIGLINDKFGSKKYGRRKPWIFAFGIWTALSFIITGIGLNLIEGNAILSFMLICSLMWNIGFAIADTALDGLILDVTPKDYLGKVQGYTWSMNTAFYMAGGIILGLVFFILNAIPLLFIVEGILVFIACAFPFYIKETPLSKEIKVLRNLKKIIINRTNWKVLIFSFIDSIPYSIVSLAYGLLVIIYMPNSPIEAQVTSLSLTSESLDLFIIYSILGALGGVGVIVGCVITGKIADIKRRSAVFLAQIMYIPFLCISVLFRGPIFLGIVMMIILGIGQGAITTSYQAIRGDIAKNYPEMDSTYYALIVSFLNGGQMFGYALSALLLTVFSKYFFEFYLIYFWIIIIMAGFQTLSLLVFLTINPTEYEFSRNLESKSQKGEI